MPPSRYSVPTVKSPAAWITQDQLAAFAASETDAHRLYSSADGWIERFGGDLLLSYKTIAIRDDLLQEAHAWMAAKSLQVRRVFGKFLPRLNEERGAPELLWGDTNAPMETVVWEEGMKFGIDFAAGYSAGLFLDQRANRSLVRRGGLKNVLNTFAYTCSFSVAAALGGARTTSVDLSRKSIDRGRENFALNALDQGQHRFFADDVLDVLPRLARKQELFDGIILDPPTFSRGNKGRRFQVEKDFEHLLISVMEVAASNARILLSTNCTRLTRRALESIGRLALKTTRRSGDFHAEAPLPDIPPVAGAETLWLSLK